MRCLLAHRGCRLTSWVLWVALAYGGDVSVILPGTSDEVVFETDAAAEIEGAMADLAARKYDEAAKRFAALADAGNNPHLRYLEAAARYEAGDLRLADAASSKGLEKGPDHAALLNLRGLVLSDLGQGDEALKALEKALAKAGSDEALKARIVLNRGRVKLDRGQATDAEADFTEAKKLATAAGANDVVALADENLTLVAALQGKPGASDTLGKVAEKLRAGDVAGAKAAIPKVSGSDRRGKVQALLAEGNVLRAEGRVDAAAGKLNDAYALAKEGGLVREQGYALAQLGVVYGVAGRYELALERLQEAIGLVSGTSFKVNEIAWRAEAGRVAVRMDDLDQARAQLAAAKKASTGVQDPLGLARLSELEGLIAARGDQPGPAVEALGKALTEFETRSAWAEAARIATEIVEVQAGRDEAALAKAKEKAVALFAKAGDTLGPAHVGIAEGLGRHRRKDLEGALKAFVAAAESAEAAGTDRGRTVARIAREDAAQALIALGHSAEAAKKASEFGLEDALKRQETFGRAEKAYEAATAAFNAGKYDEAKTGFEGAYKDLLAAGEDGYALKARKGRAWAEFNATVGKDPTVALPIWQRLVEEGTMLRDPELRVRSMAAAALDSAALEKPSAAVSLKAAAEAAEQLGLTTVAGQCWAEYAVRGPDLDSKERAARRAWELRKGDKIGTYAMYSVAVDAYNDGDYKLAIEISDEILPTAGELKPSVQSVRDASKEASAE
jgi:tetratricopeptide (TPR) repeat protein